MKNERKTNETKIWREREKKRRFFRAIPSGWLLSLSFNSLLFQFFCKFPFFLFIYFCVQYAHSWNAWRMFVCGVFQWEKRPDMKKNHAKKEQTKKKIHRIYEYETLSVGLRRHQRSINPTKENDCCFFFHFFFLNARI